MTTLLETMAQAIRTAKQSGSLCYVYESPQSKQYFVTFEHKDEWLFRVYPGGKKELSAKGVQTLQLQGIIL